MANLESALQQLRDERRQAEEQAERLGKAIQVIEGILGRNSANGRRGSRVVSSAARQRMARAQRARWARVRQQSSAAGKKTAVAVTGKKRTLSAAARRKIAAAQRARWARFRAKHEKAAA